MHCVLPSARDAALTGVLNLMKWSGMMPGELEEIKSVEVIKFEVGHRYLSYPQITTTGIIDPQVNPGQSFSKGDVLLIVRSMEGTRLEEVKAEMDGTMIGWYPGIGKYRGERVGMVAVNDLDSPKVLPWSSLPPSCFK